MLRLDRLELQNSIARVLYDKLRRDEGDCRYGWVSLDNPIRHDMEELADLVVAVTGMDFKISRG